MNSLIVEGDKSTPKINLDPVSGLLEMSGLAVPEDVRDLSSPVMKWLTSYCSSPKPSTELTLFFEYINTAATKFIFQVCEFLDDAHGHDTNVKLIWKYFRGDSEMLELGEEMFEDFNCVTEIVAVDELP
jgi:hypothetical protein